ncbi:translocating chain-associated membrane protein 2-like isoform X1 [Arapaima gigas]
MAFRRRSKSYPFFSQEFLIQNHADIVFFLVLFILAGLIFETTAQTVCIFILPQYNITTLSPEGEVSSYHYGWRDCITILFYCFITIILHAVVQEYILDKVTKRLHLSKSRNTKFAESGQLCMFHLVTSVWTIYILITVSLVDTLCVLSFQVKFYYLFQLAYWLHALPELYFQKMRKEEVSRRLKYISLYLLHIMLAYLLNLTRVGLMLLFLQSLSEMGFHLSRLFYFTDESHHKLFNVWAVAFIVTRMVTLILLFLVVGFGLARVESQGLDWETGDFNSLLIRMVVLLITCLTQSWLLWRFFCFQLRHWRESIQEEERAVRKKALVKHPSRAGRKDAGGNYQNGLAKAEKKMKVP